MRRLSQVTRACAAALQFLTRFPISARFEPTPDDLRRSVALFPAAGLGIGLVLAGCGWLFEHYVPPLIGGVLLTIVWVGLTGGLHLDGLMDTADGVLSYRSRDRMLEIMKDSRVGAMGVIAGALALLLRAALLVSLLATAPPYAATMAALIVIPMWSRAFLPTAILAWPYARAEGQGLGGLYRGVGTKHALSAGIGTLAATLLAALCSGQWSARQELVLSVSSAILAYALGAWIAARVSRKLGGLTGDVYGALNECIELGLLLAFSTYLFNVS